MNETVRASGTIWGVFGHRLALDGAEGRVLVDLGPTGIEGLDLKIGDPVSVSGQRKPSEIKVTGLTLADGTERVLKWPDRPPRDGLKPGEAVDPAPAVANVKAAGYVAEGPPRRKPKHFEITAFKDGKRHELHVGLDGAIRKIKAAA
ncbi:MAG TPA: hypothetical protein K8W01_18395 [Methylorubrum populi]|uniref:Uncharacterized protein n=1 Tax=Methylorubrum populi TaxID=223967 RepID=A0A921E662_9HYPH|nr:hypothetical protein [Methylorubrum populi]